ncbi:MAG: 50S ribosomal protein L33 [Erysipelothrix sp.]|nr:50S ribosomal protein L33 [Erysipelothrix sp.]
MTNKRKKVVLICTECLSRNYSTNVNHVKQDERLELKKYCSRCGKHTIHRESR